MFVGMLDNCKLHRLSLNSRQNFKPLCAILNVIIIIIFVMYSDHNNHPCLLSIS